MKHFFIFVTLLASFSALAAENTFITLGTAGGPNADPVRSQPANALVVGEDIYLVDAGDGAREQLGDAGIHIIPVKGLFLSHLHFDHTGGVLALLGLRLQLNAPFPLQIYGPPGTKTFIEGLDAGMGPAMDAAYGLRNQHWMNNLVVTELRDGDVVELPGATVQVAENTHYILDGEVPDKEGFIALSFRFNLEDRDIVYTGDTGPSEAVEQLAEDTDILVIEMMDIPLVLQDMLRVRPGTTQELLNEMENHFRAHHVTPEQVGEMAAAANATKLVITHMVPSVNTEESAARYIDIIDNYYDGEIVFADDLDRF